MYVCTYVCVNMYIRTYVGIIYVYMYVCLQVEYGLIFKLMNFWRKVKSLCHFWGITDCITTPSVLLRRCVEESVHIHVCLYVLCMCACICCNLVLCACICCALVLCACICCGSPAHIALPTLPLPSCIAVLYIQVTCTVLGLTPFLGPCRLSTLLIIICLRVKTLLFSKAKDRNWLTPS